MSEPDEPVSSDGTPLAMYAWHEAGHAVYAIVKQIGLISAWVDRDHAPPNAPSHGCKCRKPSSDELLSGLQAAGAAGETLLGRCDRYDIVAHAMNDYTLVLGIIKEKRLRMADGIAWIRAREIDAEQVLALHRDAFEAVARELLAKGTLSGEEVAEVMDRASAL